MSEEKLKKFVEVIAKATMREEEERWSPEETDVSDNNQQITMDQANLCDDLITEARKLTKIEGPDVPRIFEIHYKSPQVLCYRVSALTEGMAVDEFRKKHNEEIVGIEEAI